MRVTSMWRMSDRRPRHRALARMSDDAVARGLRVGQDVRREETVFPAALRSRSSRARAAARWDRGPTSARRGGDEVGRVHERPGEPILCSIPFEKRRSATSANGSADLLQLARSAPAAGLVEAEETAGVVIFARREVIVEFALGQEAEALTARGPDGDPSNVAEPASGNTRPVRRGCQVRGLRSRSAQVANTSPAETLQRESTSAGVRRMADAIGLARSSRMSSAAVAAGTLHRPRF